ncbi:MAG TPA: serine/threonine-protein kinase [Acidimicrobiales bacterium]|nr:serine/threonine-protein kinase [Acidimicrobiales bacterium]
MDASNRVVAGWILEERLGSGGFGEVWKARRRHVGLYRALKLVPVSSEATFASWRHEISRLEELSHPNIVRFYDADLVADNGPYDDFAWIATELCERSLADEMARRQRHVLTTAECSQLIDGMLGALAAAHGSGCVHRDIKPANILRHPTVGWKLCDFGTARLIPDGEAHPRTAVVGTFPYMSPAAHHGRQDQAADLYALGVTVHEALCGQRLHPRGDGMTDSEYVKFILDTPPTISPYLDLRWHTLVAALIGDYGPRSAADLLAQFRRTGGLAPQADTTELGPGAATGADQPLALPPGPPPATTADQGDDGGWPGSTSPTRPEARPDPTRRYAAGDQPAGPTRRPTPSNPSSRPPTRQPPPRATPTRGEREHLLGILALIVGSLAVAGALLLQLNLSPVIVAGLAAAVLVVMVALIALN